MTAYKRIVKKVKKDEKDKLTPKEEKELRIKKFNRSVAKAMTIQPTDERKALAERRGILGMMVKARVDAQFQRIKSDNQACRKADGSPQDIEYSTERLRILEQCPDIVDYADQCRAQEDKFEARLVELLKDEPIWRDYLKDIPGVGPIFAAYIISAIDIYVAETVSKIWQYCGLNPNKIRGKIYKKVKEYKESDGEITGEHTTKEGTKQYIVRTNVMVKADKLTQGYISPFNGDLRMALLGIGADSFIKSKSPYKKVYDEYKHRLEHRTDFVRHEGVDTPWKDVTDGHRHNAAKRYMMKKFIADLYNAWRPMQGLGVRPTYQEEKLGHVHSAKAAM